MKVEKLSFDQFNAYYPVSRETYIKLVTYADLLEKWQKSINLISDQTLSTLWIRHIIDSYQIIKLINEYDTVTDMGTGAGLPGLILAIAGHKVSLVESDGKKVAFLREVVRVLALSVTVYHQRIERMNLCDTSIVTARACATVDKMLSMLISGLTSAQKMLLLKGKNYQEELTEAQKNFDFDVKTYPSITDSSGMILLLTNIKHKRGGAL